LKGERELACFLQGYFWLLAVPRMPKARSVANLTLTWA
jgi:hypothetical protein